MSIQFGVAEGSRAGYAALMTDGAPFVELKLNLEKPPELFELISAFTAVGNQFDEYVRREHPNLEGAAQLFVKEIRQGSIIVEMIPMLAPLVANMDAALIIDNFVNRYGSAIKSYVRGEKVADATKSELKDFTDTVTVIASDPNGTSTLTSAVYHATKTTKRVEFQFNTAEAKQAQTIIARHRHEIDLPAFETKENVLMVFWQSNLKDAQTGKRTGERAIIEEVTSKPLAVVYETDLAGERIKHEIEEGSRNLYKRGFLVDCYVQRLQGRPVAYRITNVREVFDLPED